jgi:hypothetical protein
MIHAGIKQKSTDVSFFLSVHGNRKKQSQNRMHRDEQCLPKGNTNQARTVRSAKTNQETGMNQESLGTSMRPGKRRELPIHEMRKRD